LWVLFAIIVAGVLLRSFSVERRRSTQSVS
jgi:hypothetical protein